LIYQKQKAMTILEFVKSQKAQGINEWLELIKKNNFEQYENQIIDCAEYHNLIIINHSAEFINTLN
jgi:hypothetical protein